MTNYTQWYNVDGFFLDEVANAAYGSNLGIQILLLRSGKCLIQTPMLC